ncbi:unnamed protein product, partial [marine sediment metagenome]
IEVWEDYFVFVEYYNNVTEENYLEKEYRRRFKEYRYEYHNVVEFPKKERLSTAINAISDGDSIYFRIDYPIQPGEQIDVLLNMPSESGFKEYEKWAWWDSNWDYCMDITVDTWIKNYSYKIVINNTHFDYTHANTTGADFRVVNNSCNENGGTVSHYIQNWTKDGDTAVWFLANSQTQTSYSLYYGNTAASTTSNMNTTFIWGDGMEDADVTDWVVVANAAVEATDDTDHQELVKYWNYSLNYTDTAGGAAGDIKHTYPTQTGSILISYWVYI